MTAPKVGGPKPCRLGSSLITVAPPLKPFGNLCWAPVNPLAVDLVDLLSEGRAKRDNFSERHLEKLEAIGFTIECVFPGQDRGVDYKVTVPK
jgi:hypothetical protein